MAENGPEKLRQLISHLNELSKGRALGSITKAVSTELLTRIKSGFDRAETPYGSKWSPVARGGMPLQDTRRLRNAFQDASTPGRVLLHNPTVYAKLMNYGGTVRAKNAPYLVFAMRLGGSARVVRGGQVVKSGRGSKQWVKVKEVVIQPRQYLPDARGLPEEWAKRVEVAVKAVFAKQFILR